MHKFNVCMPLPLIAAGALGSSALLHWWRGDDDGASDAAGAAAGGLELDDGAALRQSASASVTVSVTLTREGTRGYGLVLDHKGEPPDKAVWIDALAEGSAAQACGRLRPGDLLIEVEGRDTQHLWMDAVVELLAAHRSVALVFIRRRRAAGVQAVLDASETTAGVIEDHREALYGAGGGASSRVRGAVAAAAAAAVGK